MYDGWDGTLEEKYNYNNVWHLVKREGNLDHWILTYEGKLALEMQESYDTDYSILFFDFNRDVEVEEKFFKKAGV